MTTTQLRLDIVSAQEQLFSGGVKHVVATGTMGEIGIFPGHAPLLTALRPGPLYYLSDDDTDELFYISGGMIEIQPTVVTILADLAERASSLDESRALAAQRKAEEAMANRAADEAYSSIAGQLAEAAAQIRVIKQLRRQQRR